MPDFFELLKTRRSIRDYEDRPVPLDMVRDILGDTHLAPSSGDGRPWRFIVITRRGLIRRLSDDCKKNLLADLEENPNAPSRKYEAVLRNPDFNVYYNAPCLVYIAGGRDVRTLHVDCALAAAYFMFSACARGLGTCWIGLGKYVRDPLLREEIGLPEGLTIVAPVILGYPRLIPPVPVREEPQILTIVSE